MRYALPTTPTDTPQSGLLTAGLVLVVALLLAVSPMVLMNFGWQYGEAGGSPLEKMHPATLLLLGLLVLSASMQGNPLRLLGHIPEHHPLAALFLCANVMLILHSILVVKVPFTMFLDTFIAPAVLYLMLRNLSEDRGRALALLIHTLMLANAALGLAEFLLQFRLTPILANGVDLKEEWRSSALLGHPLVNAIVTGSYLLTLAFGAGRELSRPVLGTAALLNTVAMVAYGGRMATLFLIVLMLALAARRLMAILSGARFDLAATILLIAALPATAIAVLLLAQAGFFDQFLGRLVDDDGSAGTRIAMLELFRHVPLDELLIGPDGAVVSTWQTYYGLDFGIESFWVSFVLSYGLLVSIPFFLALLAFLFIEVRKALRPGAVLVLVYFFAVASTSISLSAKTTLLAIEMALLMILLRPPLSASPRRTPASGYGGAQAARWEPPVLASALRRP